MFFKKGIRILLALVLSATSVPCGASETGAALAPVSRLSDGVSPSKVRVILPDSIPQNALRGDLSLVARTFRFYGIPIREIKLDAFGEGDLSYREGVLTLSGQHLIRDEKSREYFLSAETLDRLLKVTLRLYFGRFASSLQPEAREAVTNGLAEFFYRRSRVISGPSYPEAWEQTVRWTRSLEGLSLEALRSVLKEQAPATVSEKKIKNQVTQALSVLRKTPLWQNRVRIFGHAVKTAVDSREFLKQNPSLEKWASRFRDRRRATQSIVLFPSDAGFSSFFPKNLEILTPLLKNISGMPASENPALEVLAQALEPGLRSWEDLEAEWKASRVELEESLWVGNWDPRLFPARPSRSGMSDPTPQVLDVLRGTDRKVTERSVDSAERPMPPEMLTELERFAQKEFWGSEGGGLNVAFLLVAAALAGIVWWSSNILLDKLGVSDPSWDGEIADVTPLSTDSVREPSRIRKLPTPVPSGRTLFPENAPLVPYTIPEARGAKPLTLAGLVFAFYGADESWAGEDYVRELKRRNPEALRGKQWDSLLDPGTRLNIPGIRMVAVPIRSGDSFSRILSLLDPEAQTPRARRLRQPWSRLQILNRGNPSVRGDTLLNRPDGFLVFPIPAWTPTDKFIETRLQFLSQSPLRRIGPARQILTLPEGFFRSARPFDTAPEGLEKPPASGKKKSAPKRDPLPPEPSREPESPPDFDRLPFGPDLQWRYGLLHAPAGGVYLASWSEKDFLAGAA